MKFNTHTATKATKQKKQKWLASEMQDDLEKIKQSTDCAVDVHESGGELKDKQKLDDQRQAKNNVETGRPARWRHVAGKRNEGQTYLCTKCRNRSNNIIRKESAEVLLGAKEAWQSSQPWKITNGNANNT